MTHLQSCTPWGRVELGEGPRGPKAHSRAPEACFPSPMTLSGDVGQRGRYWPSYSFKQSKQKSEGEEKHFSGLRGPPHFSLGSDPQKGLRQGSTTSGPLDTQFLVWLT